MGSTPFWMLFNTEGSLARLERYLECLPPYDDIRLMLFSPAVGLVRLPPIERWRAVLARARYQGGFVVVDERRFPRDFATFARYYAEVRNASARYPPPELLTLNQFEAFLTEVGEGRTGPTIPLYRFHRRYRCCNGMV